METLSINDKKRVGIASVVGVVFLAGIGLFLFFRHSKTIGAVDRLNGVSFAAATTVADRQNTSGAGADAREANTKSVKDADWETTKILIENATDQAGLEEKIADKFIKLGKENVYTTRTSGAPAAKTSIRLCSGCSGIVIKLLATLDNFGDVRLIEDRDLTDEIRMTVGADQVMLASGDIAVSVLNGTGSVGAAGKLGDDVVSGGFKLVGTGNADRKDYGKTVIKYAPANIKKAEIVKDYLKNSYGDLEMLEDRSLAPPADVEVVIGRNR